MARTDDIINVAGHRLSTGAMEEALANHPDVAECAVIGIADELKGEVPVGLLVLRDGEEAWHIGIGNSLGMGQMVEVAAVCIDAPPGSAPGKRR